MVWGWNGLGASSFSLIDKRSWRLMFEWVTINLHSAATLTGWLWVVGGLWCAAIAGWSLMKINCKFVWLTTMKIEQKNHQPSDLLLLLLLLHRSTNIFFLCVSGDDASGASGSVASWTWTHPPLTNYASATSSPAAVHL